MRDDDWIYRASCKVCQRVFDVRAVHECLQGARDLSDYAWNSANVGAGILRATMNEVPEKVTMRQRSTGKFWEAWITKKPDIRPTQWIFYYRFGQGNSAGHTKLKKFTTLDEAKAEMSRMMLLKQEDGFSRAGADSRSPSITSEPETFQSFAKRKEQARRKASRAGSKPEKRRQDAASTEDVDDAVANIFRNR